jgi:N-acylneuraminate cytidylyltransferase
LRYKNGSRSNGFSSRLRLIIRPEEISKPTSKNEEALLHGIEEFFKEHGFEPDIVINLQPTSPIRRKGQIDFCLQEMCNANKISLMTVSKHTPFFVRMNQDSSVTWFYDPKNRPMREFLQDHEFLWHDDGCIYIMTTKLLKETNCRLNENPCIFENDPYCSLQIDTEMDFLIAQTVRKAVDKNGLYV